MTGADAAARQVRHYSIKKPRLKAGVSILGRNFRGRRQNPSFRIECIQVSHCRHWGRTNLGIREVQPNPATPVHIKPSASDRQYQKL